MKKLLTCEMLEIGRIINEGIWIKPTESDKPSFYHFSGLNFKQMTLGVDDCGVYLIIGDNTIKLDDRDITWWFDGEK